MNTSEDAQFAYRDSWLKVDGASFDNVDEAKRIMGTFVQRGFDPVWMTVKEGKPLPGAVVIKPRYIDTLSTSYHGVYVCQRKAFGFLHGSNGRGKALVTWESDQQVNVFDASDVISM